MQLVAEEPESLFSNFNMKNHDSGTKKDPQEFAWSERYKVAVGVAEALDYLHSRDDQPVIHRDVKSSNILLSDDFEPQVRNLWAWSFLLLSLFLLPPFYFLSPVVIYNYFFQLSDFGLAKWGSTTSSHITCTDVAGTFGYISSTLLFKLSAKRRPKVCQKLNVSMY